MTDINRRAWPLALILLTMGVFFGFPQCVNGQSSSLAVRQRFSVVALYRRCEPAEVRFVSFGRQPAETILAQVSIENRSNKVINAVQLGWKVFSEQEAEKLLTSQCITRAQTTQAVVSGASPIIQVRILPKEGCLIGTDPLPIPSLTAPTVFVGRAFVNVDDVKSLPNNRYTIVAFVARVQYADGTSWKASD
jgi:hypothetical protein